MYHPKTITALLLAAALAPALAQTTTQSTPTTTSTPSTTTTTTGAASEQVIVPQVDRRDVKRPRYPSNDFAFGLYGGVYSTQNFGSAAVSGLRLAYHITEDIFVDGTFGRSKVSDENYRQVLPGGIFVNRTETLSYYALSAGYNLLPGEVFFGRNLAKATQGYVLAGVGSTDFAGQKRQTVHYGFGLRLILADWFSVQADVKNHVFTLDLLGKRQSTNNPEISLGLTVFF
ncbi:MAG: outer membrane beta-barrel domain-containing protein [Rubrivivax sp.]|nr:outer membrane beta-barrel domain-containing protein [Rubrivivax sp.]